MKVVIIGAGVVGSASAYELARRGAEVVVLEADRPAGGTSGATFAWLNAFRKQPEQYFQLNLAGMDAHRQLARDLGGSTAAHFDGGLFWSSDAAAFEALHAHQVRLQAWGYACAPVSRSELRRLEPDLAIPHEVDTVFRTADEGWLDVASFVAWTLGAARDFGAAVRFPETVVSVEKHEAGARVRTAGGDRIAADAVLVTSGPATADVLASAGGELPLEQRPGFLAVSRPAATTLRHVVHAPDVHFRPDGGGRIIAGHLDHDAHLTAPEEERLASLGAVLMERVGTWLPGFRGTPPECHRIGVRPIPVDGMPVVGWIDAEAPTYTIVSHSGVTLAPLLASHAARELVDGTYVPELEPYRPSRFRREGTLPHGVVTEPKEEA